jgi:hypothetical protein
MIILNTLYLKKTRPLRISNRAKGMGLSVVKGIQFRIEIGYPRKDAYAHSIACFHHPFDFEKRDMFVVKRAH